MHKRFTETYEVHLRRGGAWTVERVGLEASEARDLGESEFRRSGVDGLRIVRSRSSKVTGSVTEDLVLERIRTPPPPDAVIGTVDEAPDCGSIEDLLRSGSRLALHRLFQGWLRSHEIGVTECLVSPKPLRLLLDNSALTRSAVHHVAALQTRAGDDTAVAAGRLHALIGAVAAKAGEIEDWVLETSRGDPHRLTGMLTSRDPGVDRWRVAGTVAALLSSRPSRLAKVETLVGLVESGADARVASLLDIFLADYLVDDDIALEVAGPTGFLSDRLLWIADTATGVAPAAPGKGGRRRHDFAEPLPRLVAEGRLPRASFALLQALGTALRHDGPLNDGTTGREQGAVVALVQRLASGAGFAGGPRLAERLARRFKTSATSADGFLDCVDTIVLGLADAHIQARFLLALLAGANPPAVQAGLLAIAERAFTLYGGLKRLARRAASAQAAIAEFDALCVLIDHAYVDRDTRDAWTQTALASLDQSIEARLDNGETSLAELLAIADSGGVASRALRLMLVRRLSRAAGIVI